VDLFKVSRATQWPNRWKIIIRDPQFLSCRLAAFSFGAADTRYTKKGTVAFLVVTVSLVSVRYWAGQDGMPPTGGATDPFIIAKGRPNGRVCGQSDPAPKKDGVIWTTLFEKRQEK